MLDDTQFLILHAQSVLGNTRYTYLVTILVTGGLGFIGSHFSRLAIQSGLEIIIIDKETYASNILNINDYRSKIREFATADIANMNELRLIFEKHSDIKTVVNFAAESHVDRSIKDSTPFSLSNIIGVSNLLNLQLEGAFKTLIQISTDEVYGSINYGYWDEQSPLEPRSPYAASKASADLLCQAFRITHNLDVRITRCANNYGPNQSVEKLIPKVICNALRNEKIPIFGDGNNIREWIYVIDHVSAVLKLIDSNPSMINPIYNLSGVPKKNLEVVNFILELLGKPKNLIEFIPDRKGHDYRYAMSSAQFESDFGWSPKFSFDKALEDTVNWYLTNQTWIDYSSNRCNT